MPKDQLFPAVLGLPNLVTLTADTDFELAMLGAIVALAGFELNLEAIDGHGVFNLLGPGTFSGALNGELGAAEAVTLTVKNAVFALAASAGGSTNIDGGNAASIYTASQVFDCGGA